MFRLIAEAHNYTQDAGLAWYVQKKRAHIKIPATLGAQTRLHHQAMGEKLSFLR